MIDGRKQIPFGTRRGAAVRIALATLVLLWSRSAVALDPSLDVSQYAHTAWRIRDGFADGMITAIAQTPDGYLWLGTDSGLLRFDGVRPVPWHPPPGEQLPGDYIVDLLVARDGTLWIGTRTGLASWKDHKLVRYPELAGTAVTPLLQDRAGTVWIGTYRPGKLCAVRAAKLECEGEGSVGSYAFKAYEDRRGNFWVIAQTGLWRWKPGPAERFPFPQGTTEVNDLIEDQDGTLLIAANDGVKKLAGGRIEGHTLPGLTAVSRPTGFFRSSDGSLWVGTFNGLLHYHQHGTDVFAVPEGLSGEIVGRFREDREGNVWVTTSGGLDRFRDYAFPSITADQGLSSATNWAVQATSDGSIWIAASDGLNRYKNGQVLFYGKQSRSPRVQRSLDVPPLDTLVRTMGVDDQDRLWAATRDGVFYFDGHRFVRVPALPTQDIFSIAPDSRGNLWFSVLEVGLFRWARGGGVQQFPWTGTAKKPVGAAALLPDPRGGLWLGHGEGGVSYFEDGAIVASWTASDGLGRGRVTHLRLGEPGTVWAATEGGLSRIQDGHVLTLTAKNGLACDAVHWSMEDDDQFVWFYMPCGLVRTSRSELDAWASDPKRIIRTTAFDTSDGVRKMALISTNGPHVTKAPDGKIWFSSLDRVTLIDPRHFPHNDLPPPVQIERITADGKVYDATDGTLRLPPRVRDLAIDYTALSFVVPEKVRFRVKLEGQDQDFRELVNERRVEYTNLPPKDYRFVVKACNDSGVWNEAGASVAFTIPPVFWQTNWFRALCVVAALGTAAAVYRVRVGALQRRQQLLERHQAEIVALNERLMKAQEEERTRIAGELHDGVLQQLTTVNLNLGVVKQKIARGSDARPDIFGVEDQLIQVGTDIRQLSHELHPAALNEAGLPKALANYCAEFASTRGIPVSCDADPEVKRLSQGTALALYRIAQEALGNVAKHARAKRVHVRLLRAEDKVRLTVSDDGVGFDPARNGDGLGVGLVNMRERVRQLWGKLEVESEVGRGTMVRAEVPFRGA